MKLSRIDGKNLAEAFRDGNREDPFPCVPPALLSAKHIRDYVIRTGAVAPFDAMEGGKRLKKAAYEGRIGCKAYQYDNEGNMANVWDSDIIVVQANSIVFVECDLDFRLPDFLALRFNLQIRHVHRGVLLGTGPLIDPGFWGKLCIPLHNLTDKDYAIPRSEGLIWIEFTKTSLEKDESIGRDPLENPNKQYWSIREFIEKAARPLDNGKTVPIRSSIPSMTKVAEERAKRAEASAREVRDWVQTFGILGSVALLLSMTGLGLAFYNNIQSAYNSIIPRVDNLQRDISSLAVIRSQIETLVDENRMLRERLQRLEVGDSEARQHNPSEP